MVSVVIPSHGRAELVEAVTRPLLDDPATLEVIVVADRDERVRGVVEAIGHPKLRVLTTDAGLPSVARQAGVEAARADLVLMIDDDVIGEPGLVSGHLAAHDRPGLVVVGYMPVAEERLRGPWAFIARLYSGSYQKHVATFERDPTQILPCFWAGNASMRRDDAMRAGVHSEEWNLPFFEDTAFGRRCAQAGLQGVFRRDLAAQHLFEKSLSAWRKRNRQQGMAGKVPVRTRALAHALDGLIANAFLGAAYVAGALRLFSLQNSLAWRVNRADGRRGRRDALRGRNLDDLTIR